MHKFKLTYIVSVLCSAIFVGCDSLVPFTVDALWIVKFEKPEYAEHIVGIKNDSTLVFLPVGAGSIYEFRHEDYIHDTDSMIYDTVMSHLSNGYNLYSTRHLVFEDEDVIEWAYDYDWCIYDLTYSQLRDSLAANTVPEMSIIDDNPQYELFVWFHDFIGPYKELMPENPTRQSGSEYYRAGNFYQFDRTFQDRYTNECYASYVDIFNHIIEHNPEDLERYGIGYIKNGKVLKSRIWRHNKRDKADD